MKELIFLDKSDEDSRVIYHFSSNLLTLIGLVGTFVTVCLLKVDFILAMFLSCSPQYKLCSHLNELFAFFPGLCFLENKRIPALTDINQTVGCRIDSEDFQKLCVEMCKIPLKSLKMTHLRKIILFKELKVFKSKFLLLQTGKFYQVIVPFPRE